MDRPQRLGPLEAFEAIQSVLDEGDETIGYTRHSIDRALERGITADDVIRVLRSGTVSPNAEWNERFQNWEYLVRGLDTERQPLAIVIALQPSRCRITLITVKDAS